MAERGARPSTGPRLPGIEGLRALAASSIAVYHVWLYGPPGDGDVDLGPVNALVPDLSFGVVLFFTLSGFLLYRPFAQRLLRAEGSPNVRRYLRNRFLRIAPAYWAILLLCMFVLGSVVVREADGDLGNGAPNDPTAVVLGLLLLQHFNPATLGTGIGPAWTLAVEIVFYLLLPLLVLVAAALVRRSRSPGGRRAAVLAPALLLLAVGFAGKAAAAEIVTTGGWAADWQSVLERSFLVHADLFAFGMALAVLKCDVDDGRARVGPRLRRAAAIAVPAAYLVTAKALESGHLSHSYFNTLMALACALLLGLVVLPAPRPSLLVRFLETRALVWVGLVSYSLFLWHEPVIRFLDLHGLTLGGPTGFLANLAAAGAIALVLSAATYRFVERPALRRKGMGPARQPVPAEQASAAP